MARKKIILAGYKKFNSIVGQGLAPLAHYNFGFGKNGINPYLGVLGGVIAVSFSPLLTKISLNNQTPPVVIAFYRLLFTVIILLPFTLIPTEKRKELLNATWKDLFVAGLSGLFLAFHFVTWFYSLKYTTAFASTVLVNLQPVFLVTLELLILKDRIKGLSIVAILISILGSAVIGWSDIGVGRDSLLGDLLAVAGAFFVAAYMLCGRILRQRMSLMPYTFTVYGICTIVLLVWVVFSGYPFTGYLLEDYLVFLGLAIICTILGHTVFNWALKYLKASVISMSILGEPIGAAVLAFLFFKELPGFLVFIGGVLVILGVLLFYYWEGKENNST